MARWVDIPTAANELNVPERKLRERIRKGQIPVLDLGRHTMRIDMEQLRGEPKSPVTQADVSKALRGRKRLGEPVPNYLGDL